MPSTAAENGGAPDEGAPQRRSRKGRRSKRRARSLSGRLFPYVKAGTFERTGGAQGHKGYLDMRVRRSNGPVCDTCGRKHYPFQGCWTGPESVKKTWSKPGVAQLRRARRVAVAQAAELKAQVDTRGPELVRTAPRDPLREGQRPWVGLDQQAPLRRER